MKDRQSFPRPHLKRMLVALAALATALALGISTHAGSEPNRSVSLLKRSNAALTDPQYLPWYTAVPTPLASAYVSIAGAFGAGNFYNTSDEENPIGTGILGTGKCAFVCFGTPGTAAHHILAYGNDINTPAPTATGMSYTHHGAADDCMTSTPPPTYECPGGIRNQVFGITLTSVPEPVGGGYIATLDGSGNFAVVGNIDASAAIVAGAGTGTPEPSPSAGSLVSYTGAGAGDLLLGSTTNYVKCDYGETVTGKLACDRSLIITNGGVRPDGGSGGFSPEAYPVGVSVTAPHPQILSGSCAVAGSFGDCTFPNSFSFADTAYNCAITVQGATPLASSYVKNSASQIAIYDTAVGGSRTFSYICTE